VETAPILLTKKETTQDHYYVYQSPARTPLQLQRTSALTPCTTPALQMGKPALKGIIQHPRNQPRTTTTPHKKSAHNLLGPHCSTTDTQQTPPQHHHKALHKAKAPYQLLNPQPSLTATPRPGTTGSCRWKRFPGTPPSPRTRCHPSYLQLNALNIRPPLLQHHMLKEHPTQQARYQNNPTESTPPPAELPPADLPKQHGSPHQAIKGFKLPLYPSWRTRAG
jgi:hypothetical protein